MLLNKLTQCYWNFSSKWYSQDSRLTTGELRKPFNSTGIQDFGEMGAGWIRWDSLLPKQLLHSGVFGEVALSVRITQGAGRRKKRSCLLGVKQFSSKAKSCVSAGLNPYLVLNGKQKNWMCQREKTKSAKSKKGWQESGTIRSVKWGWRMLNPIRTELSRKQEHRIPKLLREQQLDYAFFFISDSWRQWRLVGCVTIPKSSLSFSSSEVTLVHVIYLHLRLISRRTYITRAVACVVLPCFMMMYFHKKIIKACAMTEG